MDFQRILLNLQVSEKIKQDRERNCREYGYFKEADAAKYADCGHRPDHRGGRKAVDVVAGLEDQAGSQKPYSYHYSDNVSMHAVYQTDGLELS